MITNGQENTRFFQILCAILNKFFQIKGVMHRLSAINQVKRFNVLSQRLGKSGLQVQVMQAIKCLQLGNSTQPNSVTFIRIHRHHAMTQSRERNCCNPVPTSQVENSQLPWSKFFNQLKGKSPLFTFSKSLNI